MSACSTYFFDLSSRAPRPRPRRRRQAECRERDANAAQVELLEDRTLLAGPVAQSHVAAPPVLLNEVFINPGGIGGFREIVEIISTTGGATSLDDVWFLAVDGDADGAGFVEIAVDLSGESTGTNGLMVLGNSYDQSTPWPVGVVNDATTLANLGGRLSNFTATFMLVTNFTGEEGRDLDLDNDGTIDGAPFSTVLDAIAMNDGGANDRTYSTAVLSQPTGRPDAATRFLNNTSSEDATAWYTGDVNTAFGRLTRDYDDSNASANLPAGAQVTPGSANTLAPPMIYVNDDFTGPDGTFIIDADPNSPGDQNATIGINAFDTIQEGVDAADAGATVAITDDLATDGAAIYVENVVVDKHLSIASTDGGPGTVTIDGNAAGSVLTAGPTTEVTLTALVLQNGAANDGAGIRNLGTLNLIDTVIQNNHAGFYGGGIDNHGTLFMDGSHLLNNTAGMNGGGLRHAAAGHRSDLKNVLVDGNMAGEEGGGIWNAAGGILITRGGTTISANTASGPNADQGGGGIFNNGGGVEVQVGTSINGNSANGAQGSGGGVFNRGMMTVAHSTIEQNHADHFDGGGVLNAGGSFLIHDSVITGNHAGRFGGGFENRGGNLRIDTNETTFNSAGVAGGGVHVTGTAQTVLDRGQVSNNSAGEEGGGLWNSASGVMKLFDGINVNENVASGNDSDQGGGGIFNDGAGGKGGRLILEDIVVSRNIADGTSGSGGGILSINGVVTLDGTRVLHNTANRAGGGIELVTGILEMTAATVDVNSATGGGAGPGNGGGVHITGLTGQVGRINVIGGSVSGNTAASEGGGLWNQAGNIMVIRQGAVVSGNTASGDAADDGGGGIFNNNGRLAIGEAAVISGNTANGTAGSGGGIFSMGSGVSIEGGTTITGNAANRAGGGIEVVNGEVIVVDSTIENNNAGVTGTPNPGNGGGVHVTGTSFTRVDLRNALVKNNHAAGEGGGLWNQTNGVMLVRIGSEVSGNTASGDAADQGGGGIFSRGRLVVNAATIDGNQANGTAGSGGGIFNVGAVTTIENSTVSNNTAHRAGGGVEVVDGWVSTRNMDLVGNNAGGAAPSPGDGGGLHVSGAGLSRVTIEESQVSGNTAARDGGGIRHQAGSILVVTAGTTISGNTAFGGTVDHGGGGLFNDGGRVAITASSIWGNSAIGLHGSGGGIYSTGGGLTIDNSTLSGNMANGRGGGIRNLGELIAANATIVNNRSDADSSGTGTGGGIVNNGTATLKNTIVAGNDTGPAALARDIAGNNLQGSAHNIIGDAASAGGLIDGVNGNIVGNSGTGVLALATILDPTLADNGGPTLTHALAIGSPAINAGNNALAKDVGGVPFSTDQRGVGFPRINGGTVDMGAVES